MISQPPLRFILIAALALSPAAAWSACSVSAQGVAFGSYDVFHHAHLHSTGNISVSCAAETAYTLSLSSGDGSYDDRRMISGSDTLAYNLFTDAGYLQIWGNGTGGSHRVSGMTAGTANHAIYGRIPARQNVRVGSYTDVIIVTLEFE